MMLLNNNYLMTMSCAVQLYYWETSSLKRCDMLCTKCIGRLRLDRMCSESNLVSNPVHITLTGNFGRFHSKVEIHRSSSKKRRN